MATLPRRASTDRPPFNHYKCPFRYNPPGPAPTIHPSCPILPRFASTGRLSGLGSFYVILANPGAEILSEICHPESRRAYPPERRPATGAPSPNRGPRLSGHRPTPRSRAPRAWRMTLPSQMRTTCPRRSTAHSQAKRSRARAASSVTYSGGRVSLAAAASTLGALRRFDPAWQVPVTAGSSAARFPPRFAGARPLSWALSSATVPLGPRSLLGGGT
jgi:hypothetical protein